MARRLFLVLAGLMALAASVATFEPAGAAKVADVRNTKHNLSATAPTITPDSGARNVVATSETQICVFCHTPHGAENIPKAPLWNRKLSGATYTTYTSSSIEADAAELAAGPGGSSKLCLSCHDGTMALGNVNVLNGKANQTIALTGTGVGGTMPSGATTTSGFTRNLGVNLTNDHPISFTYNTTLAGNDGELRTPDGTIVGTRTAGVNPKPKLPLENGQVQCSTCHDPHLRETDSTKGPSKFLRLNRLQSTTPTGGVFSETGDIFCLACHDKANQAWAFSAHANPAVADELYTTAAADQRQFPASLPVWKAACLNCHDTHTVQGARRLLREGTDSTASPKAGGNSAIEETCYQCHSALGGTNVLVSLGGVPNIKSDFALARRMPITDADQQTTGAEAHDIGTGTGTQRGKDFLEAPALLGKGSPTNRHVECTDCHNPHRVLKNRLFNANTATPDAGGTHNHAAGHTNLASGVLSGSFGVEPLYGGAAFGSVPTGFDIKRGVPSVGTTVSSTYVTREYQVCLKCHSNYAYDTPPNLGDSGGGTPSGSNGMSQYTNQAMEFQPPTAHQGEVTTTDSGAAAGWSTNNHRSWHPVMGPTGRSLATRGMTDTNAANAWRAPWNASADVGTQTMYCSDCHGSSTAADTVVPVSPAPWGPHGSTNNFILKGEWSYTTGATGQRGSYSVNALCFKCHNPLNYADGNGNQGQSSGFYNSSRGNLHWYHTDKIQKLRCTWCHVAVPHGWKNKAFLVNLNDVGPEVKCRQEDADDLPTGSKCTVGQPMTAGTQMRNGPSGSGATSTTNWSNTGYTNGPYYLAAMLKIRSFAKSGAWSDTNCGSSGAPGNGSSGKTWMRDSSENCQSPP